MHKMKHVHGRIYIHQQWPWDLVFWTIGCSLSLLGFAFHWQSYDFPSVWSGGGGEWLPPAYPSKTSTSAMKLISKLWRSTIVGPRGHLYEVYLWYHCNSEDIVSNSSYTIWYSFEFHQCSCKPLNNFLVPSQPCLSHGKIHCKPMPSISNASHFFACTCISTKLYTNVTNIVPRFNKPSRTPGPSSRPYDWIVSIHFRGGCRNEFPPVWREKVESTSKDRQSWHHPVYTPR